LGLWLPSSSMRWLPGFMVYYVTAAQVPGVPPAVAM